MMDDSDGNSDTEETRGLPSACALCGRAVTSLTRHHLIPQSRHGSRRTMKNFSRQEVQQRITWLCRACHKFIHTAIDNKTLESDYNSIESLAAHPEIARFVKWISRRPATEDVRVRSRRR